MTKFNIAQAAAAERIFRSLNITESPVVRAIEVYLLRMGCASDSPLVAIDNTNPGGGILVAYDDAGRQFKIEISQVGGPQ